jgi:hypothetical protein
MILKVKSNKQEAGLFLNLKKTKIMSTTNLQGFKLGDQELEVVSSFTFLGSTIEENGDCRADIAKRLALGRSAVIGLDKMESKRREIGDKRTADGGASVPSAVWS